MEPADPAPSAIHWDRERIKALLCAPQLLLQAEPWSGWLRDHGGLAAVYAELRAYPLPKRQRATLGMLLDNPGLTAQQYADQLGVDSTTFFRYRLSLFETLRVFLNTSQPWPGAAPPMPAPAPRPAAPATSFIGRHSELRLIGDLLYDPAVRLVTLVGVGGAGKTRLALELLRHLADQFRDGACFVELADVDTADAIPAALIQALGLVADPAAAPLDWLAAQLRDRHLLMVIDTFEHLGEAAALLTTLLEAAPRLQLLMTSRARLHLTYEHLVDVAPLELPAPGAVPPPERLGAYAAIRLFAERAAAVRADFALDSANAAAVVEICRRLEGLPLAIELAASRIRHLSLPMMRQRLDNRLLFLTGSAPDRPPRQRSLRASLDWSWNLLDDRERRIFRCLAIFDGGGTLAQIERLIAALDPAGPAAVLDVLAALVDKSLVQLDEAAGEIRYRMLETVRDYALEHLREHGELERVAQLYARFDQAPAEVLAAVDAY